MDMMNAQCFKSTAILRQTLRIFGVKIDCTAICIELTNQSHGAVLVFLMRTLLASGRPETFLDQPPSERLP